MCLVLSGYVRRFDVALLWKFTNHDDFALAVRFCSLFVFVKGDLITNKACRKPRIKMNYSWCH